MEIGACTVWIRQIVKKYPNKPELHYAQGLVYLMRETSSDVEYIKNINNLSNAAIKEFVTAVGLDSTYYQAYNAMGVATLKLGNKKDAQDLFKVALKTILTLHRLMIIWVTLQC